MYGCHAERLHSNGWRGCTAVPLAIRRINNSITRGEICNDNAKQCLTDVLIGYSIYPSSFIMNCLKVAHFYFEL